VVEKSQETGNMSASNLSHGNITSQ